jgi:ABC-type multidrug transport system ATPase subunit
VTIDFEDVRATDISRHYGRRRALSRINLSVRAGEIVGLLGPNGAGKSTLIGVLSTLVAPGGGDVRYGTHTAASAGGALRARIGFLAHELHLYTELSALQNLTFFARLHGLDDPAVPAAALERAGLSGRGEDVVSGFSRGMRQRLALERALLHAPRLVLLDEPFTGLDDASTAALVARLRGLRDEGAIVILATHDLDLAEGLLDEALFLRDGRMLDTVPRPEALRSTYRSIMGTRA